MPKAFGYKRKTSSYSIRVNANNVKMWSGEGGPRGWRVGGGGVEKRPFIIYSSH